MNNWNLLQAPTKTWRQKPPYRTRVRADWKNNFKPSGLWAFNETAGNTAFDISGNGNNGALNGGVTWSSGDLSFDGSAEYAACTKNLVQMGVTKYLTLSVTFLMTGTGGMLAEDGTAFNADGVYLYCPATTTIELHVNCAGGQKFADVTVPNLTKGFQTAVVRWDGVNGNMDLFVNTTKFSAWSGVAASIGNLASGNTGLNFASRPSPSLFLGCKIRQAWLSPTWLTDAQILSLYTDPYGWAAPTLGEQGVLGAGRQGGPFPFFAGGFQDLTGGMARMAA